LIAPCNIDDLSEELEELKNMGFNFQLASTVTFPPMITATPKPTPKITPTPTVIESLAPTPTYLPPSDRNAPHLDPIYYLIPITVIFVAITVSVLIYTKYRKMHSEKLAGG
jgi:hypothetical protein